MSENRQSYRVGVIREDFLGKWHHSQVLMSRILPGRDEKRRKAVFRLWGRQWAEGSLRKNHSEVVSPRAAMQPPQPSQFNPLNLSFSI